MIDTNEHKRTTKADEKRAGLMNRLVLLLNELSTAAVEELVDYLEKCANPNHN